MNELLNVLEAEKQFTMALLAMLTSLAFKTGSAVESKRGRNDFELKM